MSLPVNNPSSEPTRLISEWLADGAIGHVEGLVIDPRNHHVTHVLLQEGHLWGRKEVAIPIGAVIGAGDGIELNLTKDQIRDLPPVDMDHPARRRE